ncbi:hypothetical protein SAMN05192553_103783 [Cyclobacterium xiamenense]|uniref:Uncharacterized protein n=1 Tax=Cyclobacterium xiamenense TaxID=1297121 RepID=A0A1H6YK62_9BACT|nr:hypothetical protein SAMN05192553_103783 [Cyclobacterium xiamenense]
MSSTAEILSILIKNQRSAIGYLSFFAVSIAILGIGLVVYAFLFIEISESSETIKLFIGIGGGFISTISAFPINQIINRIERIRIYAYYASNIGSMTASDLKKAEELIAKSIDKIV